MRQILCGALVIVVGSNSRGLPQQADATDNKKRTGGGRIRFAPNEIAPMKIGAIFLRPPDSYSNENK